eukprot:sb/3477505/
MHSFVSHNIVIRRLKAQLVSMKTAEGTGAYQISSFSSDRLRYSLAGKHSIMKHNAIIILVFDQKPSAVENFRIHNFKVLHVYWDVLGTNFRGHETPTPGANDRTKSE